MIQEMYENRILLAVTGLSPQVVTETLYALAVKPGNGRKPFVPTEIHVITTRQGAEHVRLNLLSEEPGWFHRLRREYKLPAIRFDESTLHVLTDAAGAPLDDIRTQEDNERVADQLAEIVRDLTSPESSALHVSLAGGRKTMGYYLGYALSLYGRPQDALSHVLVSAPYESLPDFYFPTREQSVIHTRGAKPHPLDCREARVELASIPFVHMRQGLDERLFGGQASFSECVASAQRAMRPAELVLDLDSQRIRAGGVVFALPPAELALLALFARHAQHSGAALPAPTKGAPDLAWAKRYLSELRLVVGDMADRDATERALKRGMDGEYFSSRLSKLRRQLRQALGLAAGQYCIDDGDRRPRRYRLALTPDAIRFENLVGGNKWVRGDARVATMPVDGPTMKANLGRKLAIAAEDGRSADNASQENPR